MIPKTPFYDMLSRTPARSTQYVAMPKARNHESPRLDCSALTVNKTYRVRFGKPRLKVRIWSWWMKHVRRKKWRSLHEEAARQMRQSIEAGVMRALAQNAKHEGQA